MRRFPAPGPAPDPAARRSGTHASGDECRCLCGNLLARLVEGQVELKCRRCKRVLRIPLEDASGFVPGATAARGGGPG